MKNNLINFHLLLTLFFAIANLNLVQAQNLKTPLKVPISQPVTFQQNITASNLKKLSMEVSTAAGYATLSIFVDDKIVVDNIDLPKAGKHNLNTIAQFEKTGKVTLKLAALGGDVTLHHLEITDVNDLHFPVFKDISEAAGLVDEPSLKYAGPTIADLDNDGDLDLVINNTDQKAFVLENMAKGKSLKITLKGNKAIYPKAFSEQNHPLNLCIYQKGELIFWSQSMALEDAAELILEILTEN